MYVHCFLDGRDTPPTSGKEFVAELEKKMQQLGVGEVASVMGRYYAMDRDKNWDRVQKAYNVLTKAEGEKAEGACAGIQESYDKEVNDEFVVPFYVEKDGKPVATIQDGDSVISSTSVRTVQERSPAHSAMRDLPDLRERRSLT